MQRVNLYVVQFHASTLSHPTGWDRAYEIKTMSEQEQKYCYLVEHPQHGTRVFYSGEYYQSDAAKNAVDYAENLYVVFKLPLQDNLYEKSIDLSAQFSAITRTSVELPSIPVEALLSSVG